MSKKSKPTITMSALGTRGFGRFGNQVFQYGFLRIYASSFNLRVETPPWIGQYLFGHKDPPITHHFSVIKDSQIKKIKTKTLLGSKKPPFVNVDLQGQFIMHTRSYAPYKKMFRSLFKPIPEIHAIVSKGMSELRKNGKTIIGIHVRRGDFLKYKDHPRNYAVPTSWYIDWLNSIWPMLDSPVLFIASDDLENVLSDFKRFLPVTSADFIKQFPAEPKYDRLDPSFYPDYYFLTQCDRLAISNSTFSFTAGLLNERCKLFVRPHKSKTLVPYDPWNSSRRLDLL
ncbi:alpha-1,2-fucosyltransferase [Paenibacillus abyssi]|uniref:Alpha-1,2-fucosyltransferase n=1 Tax=Paenibacillus abyssi TaxID=1340531 RepID=A0A917FPI2_9BACL|nr:alpha-1,2-fucosyltransferase [Paenibacillus abyssi]GGF94751.1 hypothetical protein GCM10010916_10090 [Paenibacillus abyssi]